MGCNLEFASCNDLKRSDMLPYPLPVGSERESEVAGYRPIEFVKVGHSWARTHAHNLLLPISDLLTVLMLFFSQMKIHMSKYFLFLVLVFISLLSSPDGYYLGISGYAIHQGSLFPSRQQRVAYIQDICCLAHIINLIFIAFFVCTEAFSL